MLEIKIFFEEDKSIAIMQLNGSLDTTTATDFDTKASHVALDEVKLVMIDMKQLEYISSAGLRSIFKLVKTMKSKGAKVAVSNRQAQITKVFEIIQALPDMQIFTNDQEMDDYLSTVQHKIQHGEDF